VASLVERIDHAKIALKLSAIPSSVVR